MRFSSNWGSVSSIGVLDHELFFSKKEEETIYYAENFTDVRPTAVVYSSDNVSKILNLYAHNSLLPHSNDVCEWFIILVSRVIIRQYLSRLFSII